MFHYFTDNEYEAAFSEFEGMRRRVAHLLRERGVLRDGRILDLLAGHGYLSVELAKVFPQSTVYGTGLKSDLDSFLKLMEYGSYPDLIRKRIKYVECDVTSLPFGDGYFDLVANFLGLEDAMMTRGRTGLNTTIFEVARVVKTGGLVQITSVEYGDTPEERVAQEVWAGIGLNAVFLQKEFYVKEFEKNGLLQTEEVVLHVRKKMTYEQAEDELRFACNEAPRIYGEYGVAAVTFDELMEEYGARICEHGMAYYPNLNVIFFVKEA